MVTLAFPLWLIFQNPQLNILIITNHALTTKFGIRLREYIIRYGSHFNIYLSNIKHSATHIMFTDKDKKLYFGSIRITSTGGSIVGQDADYIILDDPYSGREEDFYPSALQKKIDWANTNIEQRIEPHTKYCILHTRWHSNDLIGHYKEYQSDLFDFVEYPAITEEGKPLWEEKYTIQELERKRQAMGKRMFNSIYLQKPLDYTSDFFNMKLVNYGSLPKEDTVISKCRSWDIAASTGLKNDFTAGVPLYYTDNGNLLLTDFVHGKFSSDTVKKIKLTANEDGADMPVLIETGVAAAGNLLFEEWKNQLSSFHVEQSKPIHSKVDRATPLRNLIYDGKFYVDIFNQGLKDKFYDEFFSFPNGEHDDIVDAISHGLNWLKYDSAKKKNKKPAMFRIKR